MMLPALLMTTLSTASAAAAPVSVSTPESVVMTCDTPYTNRGATTGQVDVAFTSSEAVDREYVRLLRTNVGFDVVLMRGTQVLWSARHAGADIIEAETSPPVVHTTMHYSGDQKHLLLVAEADRSGELLWSSEQVTISTHCRAGT
ncbi:MAG: hypothetical protein H6978_09325 [Gammaproteobacteria bacterium]|nr:hypothetical protein [Gammaproteobacteria bacterium]